MKIDTNDFIITEGAADSLGPLQQLGAALPGEDASEEESVYFYITFLIMLVFFFVGAGLIEKYKPKYGHETGYTVALGILISFLIFACVDDRVVDTF